MVIKDQDNIMMKQKIIKMIITMNIIINMKMNNNKVNKNKPKESLLIPNPSKKVFQIEQLQKINKETMGHNKILSQKIAFKLSKLK